MVATALICSLCVVWVWQMALSTSSFLNSVLANGYFHRADCLLPYLCAKWMLSAYIYLQQRIGEWWLHNLQCTSYFTWANGCYQLAAIRSNAVNWQLFEPCVKQMGTTNLRAPAIIYLQTVTVNSQSSAAIYRQMVAINLQFIGLLVLTNGCWKGVDINLQFIYFFDPATGCCQFCIFLRQCLSKLLPSTCISPLPGIRERCCHFAVLCSKVLANCYATFCAGLLPYFSK